MNDDIHGPSKPRRERRPLRLLALLTSAAVLGGCASFSPDGGFGAVEQTAKERIGKDLRWARTDVDRDGIDKRVAELLARPLAVDDAVQVALLNNRGLQADFQELGITEAEVVQAGRLPNPGFSFGRMSRGDEREIERGLHFNLARLVAMPLIGKMEARRFEQTKARVAMSVLALAADTRKAYFTALAAEESVRYMRQVKQAADASAELARRMEQVGNFNKLQRAREQAFYANAALRLAQAEQTQRSTRERLVRLLGVWGPQTQFALPERLPDLPSSPLELPDIEQVALAQRLDVQGAKLAAQQTASNLGLTKTTRFVNVLELGVLRNSSNEAPTQRGWEIGLELPLFDWGGARVARAEAVYMQTLHRAAETAINARSEVREAYTGYRSAYDIARHHRDEIVPLNQRIAEENVLRYNGMLIGVFELLADARTQIASVNASIEALRDFWIAQADLDMALIGKPSLTAAAGPAMAAEAAGAGH
ncbi:TolC family protein [Ramlibacter sp.]|uniref:TolC family protein n=1 Tax=Ramlibacter sp. TaxID=1917967 RepID=UPI003D106026